jgi:hypothetical protein
MELDKLPTYKKIVDYLDSKKRPKHLLLGNGFSISYDPSIFSYNALSSFIENTTDDLLKELFKVINTKNFEAIMQELNNFVLIASVFSSDKLLVNKIIQTKENLQYRLIEAIKTLHPEHVFTISEEKSKSCFTFLEDYLSNKGFVFSTNYDLLLYWILMRNNSQNAIDGFGRELLNGESEFVPNWEPEYSKDLIWGINKNEQNIFYLHGALPLFDSGISIIKEIYNGEYLLENIKHRIDKDQYPIFVTAGNANEKLNHITHNQYLTYCYDKLCSISGSLITFGFSFGDNDDHIIDAINKAHKKPYDKKLWSIYIGVYNENDFKHIEKIKRKFKCKVNIWNANTIKIWDNNM